jgi:glycosyltransferase involved in cell wall biosynthesis
MRLVLDHAAALLIGSRSFAREVEENHGVPADRFLIVPGAVEVERFRPREEWRAGALADAAQPTLLYHGRVDRRKGAVDVVDAFARLLAARRVAGSGVRSGLPAAVGASVGAALGALGEGPAGAPGGPALVPHPTAHALPRLVVSGIGPDLEAVRDRVRAHALEPHVELPGPAAYEAVPAVYQRADVFVSPTYAEGFSNTILEAMASGVPVVAGRAVGVVDCVRDGENGLLVPPGDVEALAAAMHRLLEDAPLRARLAAAALDEVGARYAWPIAARRIVDVYATVAGRGPDVTWRPVTVRDASCRFRAAPHLL